MDELVTRFVAAFKRGIDGELAALRASSRTLELPLTNGEDLGALRYRFALTSSERLMAGSVGELRTPAGLQRVMIERVGLGHVVLATRQALDPAASCALLVAPWFLYERLQLALDELGPTQLALTLFGKVPPVRREAALVADHAALDDSQRAAVRLCAESNLAFVWGPPGTGKTTTLVHVLDELRARGERILLASTTNAAIDRILAKLASRPGFAPGEVVRLGRSDADTFGAELDDLVATRSGARSGELQRLRARVGEVDGQLRAARALVTELTPALTMQQSLFAEPMPRLRPAALAGLFSASDDIARLDARSQLQLLERRIARLERVRTLAKARIAVRAAEDRDLEARLVTDARLVLCTLTSTYLSPWLAGQRFDVLIAEEAGMATLPALFQAACRCDGRAIMVGDPRQLPPIVQSDDANVRRAIGRTIFDITAPEPERSDVVAMLHVQYRMHPAIGAVVGDLFYGGKLMHAAAGVEDIAARAPFPGQAVVVVDTPSRCERPQTGSSRLNPTSAERAAAFATEAVQAGATSVAVITPYAAQATHLRRLIAARQLGDAVECSTIHRFQGRECDVVILDLVDAAPMRPSAFVGDTPNLLNVSISRARGKLIVVADVAYFTREAPRGLVAALLARATAEAARSASSPLRSR